MGHGLCGTNDIFSGLLPSSAESMKESETHYFLQKSGDQFIHGPPGIDAPTIA